MANLNIQSLSAMVARRVKYQQLQINPKPSGPLNHDHNQSSGSQNRSYEIGAARPERMCTHCGGTGHTKSRCYELIGYPEWWDSTKAPRKRNSKTNHHASVAVVEPSHASTSNPEKASSFIATSGNVGKALHTSVSHSEWIIDSGATNHMTFDNNHIQSIKSSDQHVVSTADGTSLSRVRRSHRVPFPISMNKSPVPFMVIHSDVWGPANTSSLSGARWFVSFIDDHTRMTWICLMKLKSEVSSLFQQFHKMIATQYQSNIQVIRSDNGGEFINKYLKQYLNSHGIVHQTTCPDTPQQNGVAERKNRHLLEVVRASLFGAHMPTSYWGEAVTVTTAAYLINRECPSETGDDGPEVFEDENQGQMEVQNQIEVPLVSHDVPANQFVFSKPDSMPESHENSESEPHLKVLPNRVTRGKPKVSYEPVLNSKSKYPINNYEALKDPRWKEAMSEEMKALQKNSTWEVVDLPEGKRYLLDVVNLDWPLHQFDVKNAKNAFLHGNLQEEEVYMELPPGCNLQTEGNKQVCRLRKSLYGLKQSPRAWFGRFTSFMKSIGYKQSNSDHTLFLKHNEEQITALIVYVDDMIVTGNDLEERKTLQEHLAREFEMKDLGELKYFLGIEVSRSKKGIFLSQRKYALDLLNETGMTACSPASTPMEENLKLCVHPNQVPANKERYQRLVGRLMYLAHTRPDLAYVLSVVSQFMHSPSEEHMNAVIRILRYLKSSPGKGILFTKGDKRRQFGY
uniref:Integrase catalytic domain-containing protein n=1 Tax=Fagus sylvatica TaxID=28930 RepID=A0A2N9HZW3_FAGSY